MARTDGISLKKRHGQHFLRDSMVTDKIISSVKIDKDSSILEIGCGDGFLTSAILEESIARLWSIEIDPEWADHVENKISDDRFTILRSDILEFDFGQLEKHKPWTLLANLPYNITFPILFLLQKHRCLFQEGVIMIQEEVGQKLVKTGGRGYGFSSLFFQYYFDFKLLDKVEPQAFFPPPKVFSRLLYFKPKCDVPEIPEKERFWKFIKCCFAYPRRTLRNNLVQTDFDMEKLDTKLLALRGQQLRMPDLLSIWEKLR